MDKRKGYGTLSWVPGHVEITGNEEADEEAKRALDKESIQVVSGWIKMVAREEE
jgi:ribonuclease HI